MTRKSEGAPNPAPSRDAARLKALRAQIDQLDLKLVDLINKRATLAGEIGKVKLHNGDHVFAPGREEEVVQNVLAANKGPLGEDTLRAIFREIMSGSRTQQRLEREKVAFLGPEYSFSHLAAIERFGQSVEFLKVGSIAAVFEEVNRRHADYGVVPLNNSTDGRIADTLDMFIRLPQLKICAEVRLQVHHNLLANCEQMEIRRVYSKAQALSQCRNWLSKNVPHASLHEVSSTATAAELAQREPGAAAVASRQAGTRYGLRLLCADIEDLPYNETRFAVIGPHAAERTGSDKTALMFQVTNPNTPGSLADALAIFKQNKVNITWIECFPYRGEDKPDYVFFVDFEGHADDAKAKRTIASLAEYCGSLTVLGSFPQAALAQT
jgi:chorismate mutase/prephenate dehydratase